MHSTAIDKRQRFIEEYCVDFNATQAAIRAGYSKHTAASQASRLLTNVNVKEQIATIKNSLAQEAGLTALDYWRNLRYLFDFDPAELFDENGMVKDLKDIPYAIRKCLKRYKVIKKIIIGKDVMLMELNFVFPDQAKVLHELGKALRITV